MRLWVAMSGGVDSSVAAALLVEEGHDVTGVTLALLVEDSSAEAARQVCDMLGIPHIVLDARTVFEKTVVTPYVDAYASGRTPNPCVWCNARVKFGWLLERAAAEGVSALATGHYARLEPRSDGSYALMRATDSAKDQSYFLYSLAEEARGSVRFPLGSLTKTHVRQLAQQRGLPTAHREESQEACFTPATGHVRFLCDRRPELCAPGPIVDTGGVERGTHSGIAGYTVGQRKGLRIGGTGEPLFVVRIDAPTNTVVVGPGEALSVTHLTARGALAPGRGDVRVHAAFRYRMEPRPALLSVTDMGLEVTFETPVRGVAPGQSVVCYVDDEVVAGGEITCTS